MTDKYGAGYPMKDRIELSQDQIRVWANATRQAVLTLIGQRAATISQLADALDKPKGTIGHHVQALERAGLVRVIRTRKVRAMTEKYYGRVAWTFEVNQPNEAALPAWFKTSLRELETSATRGFAPRTGLYRAQIPESELVRFAERLEALASEFGRPPAPGEPVFGLLTALFLTKLRAVPPTDGDGVVVKD
jgi:DNA-binding transcriptional ArsR family regulator